MVHLERLSLLDEIVEAAAEASAPHVLGFKTGRTVDHGVDEIVPLVIGDDPDFPAARPQTTRKAQQSRRLAGAEITAEYYDAGHRMRCGPTPGPLEIARSDRRS